MSPSVPGAVFVQGVRATNPAKVKSLLQYEYLYNSMTMTAACHRYSHPNKSHFIIILAFLFASKSGGLGGIGRYYVYRPSQSSFVSAVQHSRSSSSAMSASSEGTDEECSSMTPIKVMHHQDPNLWLYHVEKTTSTMDEARKIVDSITTEPDDSSDAPKSFLISASSQSRGRGTTQRNWKSSQRGNSLFTIGIPQSSWMIDLKKKNDGTMIPLTLLPLRIGSLVAQQIQNSLEGCIKDKYQGSNVEAPTVTVKWPNDVLLKQSSSTQSSYEKVAGILIESAKDWFIIGIGINVGYAPHIPKEGVDFGRQATCFSRYCNAAESDDDDDDSEEYWVEVSKKLAIDIAYDLHSWLHSKSNVEDHSGEAILDTWKSFLDWDMELVLRDKQKREHVTLTDVKDDGRVIVREVETGIIRTLVADYFV